MKRNTKLLLGVATGAVILGTAAFLLTRPAAAAALPGPQGPPGPGPQVPSNCPVPGSLGVNNTQNQSVAGQVDSAQYTMTPGHQYTMVIDPGVTSASTLQNALTVVGLTVSANLANADPCAVSISGTWTGAAGPIAAIRGGFSIRTVIDDTLGTSVLS